MNSILVVLLIIMASIITYLCVSRPAKLETYEKEKLALEKDYQATVEYYQRRKEELDNGLALGKSNIALVQQDMVNHYLAKMENLTMLSDEQEIKLNALRAETQAAIELNKRANENKDFYSLRLSSIDIKEIDKIKEIAPYLRDDTPLNKVIWKSYYENPYTDMVGRVLGKAKVTGIYKITNRNNQKVYVGQAVNVADRWKQHIKCAIGAEAAKPNKLYSAMKEEGIENFTFELIESCTSEELNSREKFWIDYFKCLEYGYNMRLG